ncbi:hypothetical protein G7067_09280 [Leucobacter insecticola]|uniref:Secreted protein n=1 Tax=Leucobacter insecticola TaxID=2714934 RepID=A0A6G8FJK5_9MICO|nr:hypothetical protein G7067_09280 [Leucobacter insecticola]
MNPRRLAVKTFCAVAGGVLTAVALTAPAIASPQDGTLPATEALSEGGTEAPVENPLLPPAPAPVPFAANEYTIGGPSAACTIGTDATGIITVTDAGNGLLDLGFDIGKVPAPGRLCTFPLRSSKAAAIRFVRSCSRAGLTSLRCR